MLNDDERNKNKVGVFNPKTKSYLINPCYDEIIQLKDGFIAHDYDLKTTVI